MKTFEAKLVEAVKAKRDVEGLSIRALSAKIGVSFSTLARIERGDGLPDNNSKIRLIQWLGDNAGELGLAFDNVAFVHFRAAKNVGSTTVHNLLRSAELIRSHSNQGRLNVDERRSVRPADEEVIVLSKEELEKTADRFRKDLGLKSDQPLDSLKLKVESVAVHRLTKSKFIDEKIIDRLAKDAATEWSAMSVPLNGHEDQWAIFLNDTHTLERQRVTLLEEYWHILLGHKLTKIAKIAESYGRTYDKVEEHDAYYLASATLLPRDAIIKAVQQKKDSETIAKMFGTSSELVDYRIKRLGLWREHVGKKIALESN